MAGKMDNNQVVITGTLSDRTVYVHVLRTYEKDTLHYVSILDMKMPGADIVRNIGFDDDEIGFIRGAVKGADDVLSFISEKNVPLCFSSIMDFKMRIGDMSVPVEPASDS